MLRFITFSALLLLGALFADADASLAARAQTVARTASMALGAEHSCAIADAGGVRCWGWNRDGQLGSNSQPSHSVPVEVDGLHTPILQVAAGYNHTCALGESGSVQCWGSNTNGQLGTATTDRCEEFACSRKPVDVSGTTDAAAVAAGFAHTCAITSASALKCWGFNLYGQLGDGTTTDRIAPSEVSGLDSGVAAVAPGDVQTCALMSDGTVRCWGNNLLGELGDGTRTTSMTPVIVCGVTSCEEPIDDIVQLSAGDYHTCALSILGDVSCWGSNISGQLGVPGPEGCSDIDRPCSSTVPLRVSGLDGPAAAISASTASTCALIEGGAVQCWGQVFGSRNVWTTPVPIDAWQSGITGIAAAQGHACALTEDAETLCFGANRYGQLGDGTYADRDRSLPGRVWLLSGRGDADCDTRISSLDAALVLQLVAGLTLALPCANVAAAVDDHVTSVDALAILQLSAGLLV